MILLVAAALRLWDLTGTAYSYDECWKAELSAGGGSAHERLPVDVVFHRTDVYDPQPTPPWWHVWTRMECTHPPLYYVLLRFWTAAFGRSDAAERAFAAAAGVAAVAVLYDAVRLLDGPGVARWAAALMAVAAPSVQQARMTSNYALELLTVLAVADGVARVQVLGPTRRRLAGVTAAVLAAALTHYFAAGALAGLAAYAAVRLRGRGRLGVLLAFAAAAVVWLACWGPWFWQQRGLFAAADPATAFLRDGGPDHVGRAVGAALAVPFAMLGRTTDVLPGGVVAWAVGLAVYAAPAIGIGGRRRDGLWLWSAVLLGTLAVVTGLDVARATRQTIFVRYVLLAGPPTYAIIPTLARRLPGRWLAQAVPAATLAWLFACLPTAFRLVAVDPRHVADALDRSARAGDLVVLLGTGPDASTVGTTYLLLDRYLPRSFPADVAVEHGAAGLAVRRRIGIAAHTFVLGAPADPHPLFPQSRTLGRLVVEGRPFGWVLAPATAVP